MMPVYGDLRKMRALGARLADLSKVPSRASKAAAEGINERLQEQYEQGVDPYGNAWAELAPRTQLKHGPPPLTETGDMAEGTRAYPGSGAGIEFNVPFPGGIHQTGASKGNWRMPARKILPEGAALPPAWKEEIDDATKAAFDDTMRKKS